MHLKFIFLFIVFSFISDNILASTAEFKQCYDYGCKSTTEFSFNQQQWKQITAIFSQPALSPWLEKQQIRQAIALMEEISGAIVGTSQDKGGNYQGQELTFQQDCIDESTNTSQYLNALQQRQLFHWHQVDQKKRRIVWLFTHWTAVIREQQSNELFAVDSWYRDNGDMPYIQKLQDWNRKSSFPESLNP